MKSAEPRYAFSRRGAISWAGIATAIYVTAGLVAARAQGLAAVSYLLVAVFITLTALGYAEAQGLRTADGKKHLVDQPGAGGISRLAFNDGVSFVVGWAIVLDLLLLTAIGARSMLDYLAAWIHPLSTDGTVAAGLAIVVIVIVGVRNARGPNLSRGVGFRMVLALDALVLTVLAVLLLIQTIHDGLPLVHATPGVTFGDVAWGATIGVVAVTGFETAASLGSDVRPLRSGKVRKFLVLLAIGTTGALVLAGMLTSAHRSVVVGPGHTEASIAWLATALHPHWLGDAFKTAIAILAAVTLLVATNGAMLAVSRIGSAMATHRQIPARLGRIDSKFGTPTLVLALAVLISSLMVALLNRRTLIGLYAFGALFAITMVQLSILRLRFTQATAVRRFSVPGSIPIGSARLPVLTVFAFLLSLAGWGAVILLHKL